MPRADVTFVVNKDEPISKETGAWIWWGREGREWREFVEYILSIVRESTTDFAPKPITPKGSDQFKKLRDAVIFGAAEDEDLSAKVKPNYFNLLFRNQDQLKS